MESKEKVEMIEQAIQQLMGDQQQTEKSQVSLPAGNSSVDGEDNQLLLSSLLSQLQTMKNDGDIQQQADLKKLPSSRAVEAEEDMTTTDDEEAGGDTGREEIVKELKKVQRQNFITHCLLSAMIVLTITWQLSEVSLILKLKDGINHPFRSVGSLLKGMIKRPRLNARNGENQTSSQILAPIQQQIGSASLPSLKIPDVTQHFDLGLDSEEK